MAIDSNPEYTSDSKASSMEGTIMDEEMPTLVSIDSNVIITSTMHATVMSIPLTIATDATIIAANPWNQPKYHTVGLAFGTS